MKMTTFLVALFNSALFNKFDVPYVRHHRHQEE